MHPHSRVFDLKRFGNIDCKKSLVIVVSPLLALMEDQVSSFTAKGLAVGSVTHKSTAEEKQRVREGKFQLVFFSPESLLAGRNWREVLQSEPYRSNTVAFVVDEAHCVHKW